jgi:hypothetical protein
MELGPDFRKDLEALDPVDRASVVEALHGLERGDDSQVRKLLSRDYEEPPVDILTFIDDPRYLGNSLTKADGSSKVYSYWRDGLVEIFKSNATHVVMTGPIGGGKSTIIDIAMAYHLYDVINLHDPFEFYDLIRAQEITLLFFSLSKDLSDSGLYSGFMKLITNSPWFCERGVLRGFKSPALSFDAKNVGFSIGSPKVSGYGITGRNVIAGGLDEISAISTAAEVDRGARLDFTKMKALKIYQQVARRMESRFRQVGVLPGKLYMASSKEDEAAFLERYIEKIKHRPDVLIFDDPIWEMMPDDRYPSGRRFLVAAGDRFKPSRIMLEGEDEAEVEEQGYEVLEVPEEHRPAFELDVNGALRDIAGMSSSYTKRSKLIARPDFVKRCIDISLMCPFTDEVVYLSEDDDEGIEQYFKFLEEFKSPHTRFIHADLALTGDAAGLGCGHVAGRRQVTRIEPDGTTYDVMDDVVTMDFMVQIRNIEGLEIPFWKLRRFIVYLRQKGMRIGMVTFDGFQSADGRQLLKRAGFNSEILSVDKDDKAYIALRSAMYEERFRYYHYPIYEAEVCDLEHDRRAGKVDHPYEGSKDVSDCAAGVVYSSQIHHVAAPQPEKAVEVMKGLVKEMSRRQGAPDIDWLTRGE